MWPELDSHSSNLAFARVRCVGRRLPRTFPDVATSYSAFVDPIDRIPARYLPVETFPGAACYATMGSAMIFRAIMRKGLKRSKAAPLQAMGMQCHVLFLVHGTKRSR